jgi:predicted ATP-grasp superfamily ATP-dependent carboligase
VHFFTLKRLAKPSPTPAVVVGGTLNALGVVRSLARARVPVYLLETTQSCAAGWSRHCKYVRSPAADGRELIDTLAQLATRLRTRPILILTSDLSVNTVSEHRREIEPLYRVSLPTHDVVRTLADKTLFQAFAEREGFLVPRAVCASSPASLEQLDGLQEPLVVKPADKTLVLSGRVTERAIYVATRTEARRVAARMLADAPRVLIQEWIDGHDSDIFFTLFSCDREGNVIGLFPGRKLLCSPPAVGNTALCIAAPEVANELFAPTLRLVQHVCYRGLGSLEFKRDRRTGRFVIIEPTVGRTDWQEEIATLCGVNLPLLTYYSELGETLPRADGPYEKVAWRSSMEVGTEPVRGVRVFDGFARWSDPTPALYYYGYERGLLRLWRRTRGVRAPSVTAPESAKE